MSAIRESGAEVVCAVTLIDRGELGKEVFQREGVPYFPVLTYRDIGIPPVAREPKLTSATA